MYLVKCLGFFTTRPASALKLCQCERPDVSCDWTAAVIALIFMDWHLAATRKRGPALRCLPLRNVKAMHENSRCTIVDMHLAFRTSNYTARIS